MALSTEITPDEAWSDIQKATRRLKDFTASRSAEFANGTIRERVLDVYVTLIAFETKFNAKKGIPGLVDYVRTLKNDPNNDVVAATVATLAALDTVISNILSVFPKSGDSPLSKTMSRAGIADKLISAAALSGVIDDLDAVSNGIS